MGVIMYVIERAAQNAQSTAESLRETEICLNLCVLESDYLQQTKLLHKFAVSSLKLRLNSAKAACRINFWIVLFFVVYFGQD